ncbi:MAG: hypothetical protein HYT94_03380 [Parcubacteria group bacterium]|nr:hypothetical protein [Parcubacteria group bacterium]
MGTPEALALGVVIGLGFWGWLIVVAEFCLLFAFVEFERGGWGFVSVFVFAVLLYFVSDLNLFGLIWHHPWLTFAFLAVYFSAGAAWSCWKWRSFTGKRAAELSQELSCYIKDRIRDISHRTNGNEYVDRVLKNNGAAGKSVGEIEKVKAEWLQMFKTGRIPDEFLHDWNCEYSRNRSVPTWSENKDRIVAWIMFWPWSVMWYVLADVVKDFCEWIVSRLKNVYNSIAQNAYKDIDPRLLKKKDD